MCNDTFVMGQKPQDFSILLLCKKSWWGCCLSRATGNRHVWKKLRLSSVYEFLRDQEGQRLEASYCGFYLRIEQHFEVSGSWGLKEGVGFFYFWTFGLSSFTRHRGVVVLSGVLEMALLWWADVRLASFKLSIFMFLFIALALMSHCTLLV